jgi:DNA-binding GntR family transcriptional regulator
MAPVKNVSGGTQPPADGPKDTAREPGAVMHEHVYEKIREALISGQLEPGRTISVRRLASEYAVSAMPAREAIRRLVAMGALELTDTRRVTIAKMSDRKFAEIRSARLKLEPMLAGLTLAAISGKQREKKRLLRTLKKTDGLLDESIKQGRVTDYTKHNSDFHFALYRASGSLVLLGLVESLWLQFGPFMRIVIGRLGTSCLVDDRHKEIIEAIEGDQAEDLEAAVRADILHGMDNISTGDFKSRS